MKSIKDKNRDPLPAHSNTQEWLKEEVDCRSTLLMLLPCQKMHRLEGELLRARPLLHFHPTEWPLPQMSASGNGGLSFSKSLKWENSEDEKQKTLSILICFWAETVTNLTPDWSAPLEQYLYFLNDPLSVLLCYKGQSHYLLVKMKLPDHFSAESWYENMQRSVLFNLLSLANRSPLVPPGCFCQILHEDM